MQGLTSSYARYLHRDTTDVGHVFRQRFQSILIDPVAWLPELARFIHASPVRVGLVMQAQDYAHSSARVFLDKHSGPWLDLHPVLNACKFRGLSHLETRAFLISAPSEKEIALFSSNHRADSRIVGDAEFRDQLPYAFRPHQRQQTLERLIDHVIIALEVERDELFSKSRRHRVALTRSVIAWHARELRLANLTHISRVLGRDVSTLSKSIARHRKQTPRLFTHDAFQHLMPLG
jgi:hypothetical protein